MSQVDVSGLSKKFYRESQCVEVIRDLTLHIEDGELVCIFGPNGCGKTSLLNILAGTLAYHQGTVSIDTHPPLHTSAGVVFQNYSDFLLPWLRGRDNILLPLKVKNVPLMETTERLADLVGTLSVGFSLDAYPYQLSGGQQQIVSLLRAMIDNNGLCLLDEPFSNLDYRLKEWAIRFLLSRQRKERSTTIMVTHNLEDAILLADRIIAFKERPLNNNYLSIPAPSRVQSSTAIISDREFQKTYSRVRRYIAD